MVSKALVTGAYQKKLEELAKIPGVELLAIVPPYWHESRVGVQRLEKRFVEGYQLLEFPMLFNGRHHIHFYPGIGRHIRAFKPDVLHIDEEPYNWVTLHTAILGRAAGAKTIFFSWQNLYRHYPPPFRMIELANYRLCAAGVAGNQEAVGVLRRKGYRGPIDVIPQFGVDPSIYAPTPRRRDGPPVIGFAGRLVPEKGVDTLLKAIAGMRTRVQLQIIGNGTERSRLEHQASLLGIRDRVTFRGVIASSEMPDVLGHLDALVVPSLTRPNWKEQFGRVIIEAMSCEVPVIGSDSGEIPNVIGEADLIVPEGRADNLAERLDWLVSDEARRREYATAARQRVLDTFTQERIAARFYDVYESVLAENKS